MSSYPPAGAPTARREPGWRRRPAGPRRPRPVPRYPLMLSMAGRRAVVVGGGQVALRRAPGLLEAGANVVVIAPAVLPELADLPVTVLQPRVPRRRPVRRLARARGDRRPGRQRAGRRRGRAQPDLVRARRRRRRLGGLDPGGHPARRDHGRGDRGRRPAPVAAAARRDRARARRRQPAGPAGAAAATQGRTCWSAGICCCHGSVALIGGGPGDPGLITVLGRRLLAEADVVVTDKLAPRVAAGRARPRRRDHRRRQAAARAQPDPGADQRAHRGQGAEPASGWSG